MPGALLEDKAVTTVFKFLNAAAPLSAGVLVWYVSLVITPLTSDIKDIKSNFLFVNTSIATLAANATNLDARVSNIEKIMEGKVPEILVLRSEIDGLKQNISELRRLNFELSRNINRMGGG
jgi:hypothetical protein